MFKMIGLFVTNFFLLGGSMDFGSGKQENEDYPINMDQEKSRNLVLQDPVTVSAVVGDKAAIPCSVSMPLEADEATLILWYQEGVANPIYTLDIRNVPFKGAKHFPSTKYLSRAFFNVSVHPPVLILSPVFEEDKGEYRCRVDLRRSRTLIIHSRLRVIVPPSDPIIMDEHGQHLYDVIGPYDEGSNLTFICEVDGGDPSPNVTWWRGENLIDDDFNVTTDGFVRNELFLYEIQRSDLLVDFTCRAENTFLAGPKDATILVDINLLPLEARIILPKPILIAGEGHEIICETKGSRPRALTTWWLEGQKIGVGAPEGLLEDSNDTLTTLHFTPKPTDDGKHLSCKSVNPALPKKIVEDEIILKVQFIPLVNISLSSLTSHSRIKEGHNVSMECTIWANPWITNIMWQIENRTLVSNRSAGIIIKNQTIHLYYVNKNHRGRYRCVAYNSVGEGRSKYLKLYIQFTPSCRSTEPKIYGIAPMEILNVTCDIEADPRDTQIRWSLNNSQGVNIITNWTKGGPRSIFSYSPKADEGYGFLMCWAKNSLGTQKMPCIIKVVPAGAPESPHDCLVINQTSEVLVIDCEPGYNGSLTQVFHMEVYDSVMEHMTDNLTKIDRPSFQAKKLLPGTSYVLVIYASNVKGRSNSVALVGTTLHPAEKRTAQDAPASFSPVLFILIGIIVLAIVCTIAVVFILRTHTHSDKRQQKDSPAQTTIECCELPKKDLEESQDTSEKGPDIIPMSKDSEVFYMGKASEDSMFDINTEETPKEYVRQKYTDTVL